MKKYHFLLIAVLCLYISDSISAQPRGQRQQMQPGFVFFEKILLPSEKDGMTRLDINYRVMKNFFVFKRASADAGDRAFEGGYELSIELFDASGQSRAREIKQERLFSDTPTLEFPNIDYIEGGFSFNLPEGEYRFLIRLNDQNSQRRYTDRDSRIKIPGYPEEETAIFDFLFVESILSDNTVDTIRPVNLGGNLFFGENAYGTIIFKSRTTHDAKPEITYRILRADGGQRSSREIVSGTIPGEKILKRTRIVDGRTDDSLYYNLIDDADSDYHVALFPIHSKTFDEGMYRIHISIEENEKKADHTEPFRVQWIDKPASLRNLDFAIEMLEYIMTPEEYRELRRGSSDERRRKFIEYWKGKDPDPETAYNPVKTEFYRRVDYAAREFTSLREQNGARTDRGKIYILYGPPTSKDRSLIPGQAPQETWKYRHLNQKFIFVDQSRQGNYRLTTREEL